jgi:hypothetical protein
MARDHANLHSSIISDPDWRALGPGPQWLYVHLLCQPDLKLTGLAKVEPEWWAAGAAGLSPEHTSGWFAELVAARFLLHDPITAELLIRTFTKHDLRATQLTKPVSIGFWSHWNGGRSLPFKRYIVAHLPDDVWARLEPHAPTGSTPDVAETRRSGPFDWEPPSPIEWQVESPFEPPSTFHLPPAAHPALIISPTGRGEETERPFEWAPGSAEPGADGVSPAEGTPTAVGESEQPALGGEELEQAVRRTAVLIGRRQTAAQAGTIDQAEAYAAACTRRLIDKRDPDFTPEPREAITAAIRMGMTPEEAADAWLTRPVDVFGFSTGDRPRADDPESAAKATERAKDRERETRERIDAMAAIEPAPMPDHLRRRNRHPDEQSDPVEVPS